MGTAGSHHKVQVGREVGEKAAEAQLVAATGDRRSEFLRSLIKDCGDAEGQDFYSLFGLQRYCDITEDVKGELNKKYKELMLKWHPDKNPPENNDECHVWTVKIALARKVLEDRDLKRRYDKELRKQLGETDRWSSVEWYLKWGYNVAAMMGGAALIVAGASGAAFSGGTSLVISAVGSSLLVSGMQGAALMYRDPNSGTAEFVKNVGVGAIMGAAGGGVAAGGACAIAAVGSAAAQVAIGAGGSAAAQIAIGAATGAAATVTGQCVSDVVDLAITEGMFGDGVCKAIPSCKSREEIFSAENGKQLMLTAAVGAVAGGVVQGGVCLQKALPAQAAGTMVDDAANVLTNMGKTAFKSGTKMACRALGATVAKQAINTAEVAAGASLHQLALCAAGSTILASEPFFERIVRLAPDVQHMLVRDASRADFMLSRTNLQKELSDNTAVALLREGFKLCADNSLADGWGGRKWVQQYVEDARKTKYGVLVLEGGEGFFQSKPCCDELYAAKKAGLNLTKVHGDSIKKGQYLWVHITDTLFSTTKDYEVEMRAQHGEQFTPYHHTVEMGGYYKGELEGNNYTYYCVVPRGRAAAATGAGQQMFAS